MPKKTNDLSESKSNIEEKNVKKKTITKKSSVKKVATKKDDAKKTATKKVASNKADTKKTTAKKVASNKADTKKTTAKKFASKKADTKKTTAKKVDTKKTDTKRITPKQNEQKTKKSASKKVVTKKKTATKTTRTRKAKPETLEYYDLPYRYNKTLVKILAQTPNTLFVYWDIADADRKKYNNQFGDNFFETTIPVLIVHNRTKNYSFQIEINDFANSWYFSINDTNCDYEIELGRIAKPNTIDLPNNYMYIASSNDIETPNDHILFEKEQKVIFFRNVKNNHRYSKDIAQFDFMKYMGRIYNIYDIYKKIYKLEDLRDLDNPSSSFNKGAF